MDNNETQATETVLEFLTENATVLRAPKYPDGSPMIRAWFGRLPFHSEPGVIVDVCGGLPHKSQPIIRKRADTLIELARGLVDCPVYVKTR